MLDLKALLSKILTMLGFVDIRQYNLNGVFTIRRIAHIINISYIGTSKTYSRPNWNTIATLSADECPSSNINFSVWDNATGNPSNALLCGRVLTTGQVQVYVFNNSPSTNQPYFNVTYVVDGGVFSIQPYLVISFKGVALC